MAMKENVLYYANCNKEMKDVLLPRYEYDERFPLHNVAARKCPKCAKIFFTEAQAKEIKALVNQ
jgi:hypothetical protein